jgi:hypothetical protein
VRPVPQTRQDGAAGTEFQSPLGEDAARRERSDADADDQIAQVSAPKGRVLMTAQMRPEAEAAKPALARRDAALPAEPEGQPRPVRTAWAHRLLPELRLPPGRQLRAPVFYQLMAEQLRDDATAQALQEC